MIKKIIKNTILISLILNFIICSILNTYTFFNAQYILEEITEKTANSTNMTQLTINVQEGKNSYDFIKEQYLLGQYHILSWNFTINIISLIIGLIISLTISMDESKRIKHILIFIIGNISLNTLLTFILIRKDSYISFINFIYRYIEIFKDSFIFYVISYVLIICIKLIITQFNIKKMNNLLNKKN